MAKLYRAKFKVTLEIGPLLSENKKTLAEENEFVIKARSESQVYDLLDYLWYDGNPESFVDCQKLLDARDEALEENEDETVNWEFDTVSVEEMKKSCDYDYDAGEFKSEIAAYKKEFGCGDE